MTNGKDEVAEFGVKHEVLVARLFDRIDQYKIELVDRIREIAEIPAPTFREEKRTEYLKKAFAECGLSDVHSLPRGSVLAYTRAKGDPDTLLLAAHIDHVFPAGTDLSTRIENSILHGPGTGDNATNLAALVILADLLREMDISLARNVAFCGTACEEGNGNLAGMAEVLEALGGRLHQCIAVDGQVSSVVNRSLAIRRYLLKVNCPGGHSWGRFGTPSAVHEMARIINGLCALEMPVEPKTTFNVGNIHGGTSVNAIAQECEAEVDLRSLETGNLEKLESDFLAIVENVRAEHVEIEAQLIGDRPAAVLAPGDPLVQAALGAAEHVGLEVALAASSTDAALPLSRGIPSISFGIYRGDRGHTLEEFVELDSLAAGLKRLALAVLLVAGIEE